MECIPLNETFSAWLLEYGSIILFVFLVLGIIALPIPDETLMVFAGMLMDQGSLNIIPTVTAAYLGSIFGITLSYYLGRTFGNYITHKYGAWIGLTPARLENVEAWLKKYGKWTLSFGYFLPGIRHFTGFATGMAKLPYKEFALFAYLGAFVWVTTFLSVGFFIGNYCFTFVANIPVSIEDVLIVIFIAIFIFIAIKYNKKNLK